MLLPQEVFLWLKAEGGLKGSDGRQAGNGSVELSETGVDSVLSGQAVAKLLSGHMQKAQGASSSSKEVQMLDRIGHSHGGGTGASERLYAWNMMTPLLGRLNVTLTPDEKTLMVAGDDEVALHVLKDLRRKIGDSSRRPSQDSRVDNRGPGMNGARASFESQGGYKTPRSYDASRQPSGGRDARGAATPISRSRSTQGSHSDQSYPNPFNPGAGKVYPGHRSSDQTPRSRSQTPINGQQEYTVLPGISGARSSGAATPYQGFRQSSRGSRDLNSGYQGLGNDFSPPVYKGNEARNNQYSGYFAGRNGIQPASGMPNGSSYSPVRYGEEQSPLSARGGPQSPFSRLASLLSKYTGLSTAQALQAIKEPGQGLVKEFLEGDSPSGAMRPGSPANFLQDVLSSCHEIVRGLLAEDSSSSDRSIGVVLHMMHWGLLSRSMDTASAACRIVTRLADELIQDDRFRASKIWMWFSDPEPDGGPIAVICTSLQRHEKLASDVVRVLRAVSRDKIGELFSRELPARFGRTSSYLRVARLLVLGAKSESEVRTEIVRQGALHKLLQMCISESKPDKGDSSRMSGIWLITALWQTFPAEVAATPAGTETFDSIRAGTVNPSGDPSDKASDLQAATHEALFELLSAFIGQKSPNASTTYKLIVGSLLENYQREKLREFTQRKLGVTLQANPRMPLGILVEPLMKKVRACGYNGYDIEFHLMLSKHPRLEPAQALMILDVEARICFSDPNQTQLAGVCLIELLRRFEDLPSVSDFVDRLARLGLGIVQSGRHEDVHDKELGGKQVLQRKLAILDIIYRIADLRHNQFNGHISNHLQSVLVTIQSQNGKVAYKATLLAELLGLARPGESARFRAEQARSDASNLSPRPHASPERAMPQDFNSHLKHKQDSYRSQDRSNVENVERSRQSESEARHSKKDDSFSDHDESYVERVKSWKRDEDVRERKPARYSQEDDKVLQSDEDQPVQESKMSAAERRAANAERAKKQEEERKAAILAKREARKVESKDPVPPEDDKPKGPTASERRAANMERAKKMEEERKAAILAKRADRSKEDLPNFMTEEQIKKQVPKKVRQSRQPDRPSSVLRQRRSSSRASRGSEDERLSLPPPEAPNSHRSFAPMRPPSAKTRKREAEISEIRRKRDQRMRDQQAQQEKARQREKELFDHARREVERRMAVLKQQKDEDAELSRENSELSDSVNSVSRKPSAHHANRVDLSNPKHQGFAAKFDLERHSFMWRAQPRRRETVKDVVTLLEDIFNDVTHAEGADKADEDLETRGRKKGARMRRGEEDEKKVLQERNRSMTPAGRLDMRDKELLNQSSLQNDEQLRKLLKRQEYLRKKLAQQREEKRAAEEERLREEQRLKKAMVEEKRREKEAEEARRKKIKEKLARYKASVEQERHTKNQEIEEKERLSKADRKKKLQDYLKKKQAEEEARTQAASKQPQEPQSPNKKAAKKSVQGTKKKNPKLEVVDLLNSDYVPSPTYLEATGKSHMGAKSPMASPRSKRMSLKAKPGKVPISRDAKANGADQLDGKGVTKPSKAQDKGSAEKTPDEEGGNVSTEMADTEGVPDPKEADETQSEEAPADAAASGDAGPETIQEASEENASADQQASDAADKAEEEGQSEEAVEADKEESAGKEQDLVAPNGEDEKWEVDDSAEGGGNEVNEDVDEEMTEEVPD